MKDSLFNISDLSLELDDSLILEDISCELPFGKISVIVGPSGAGKSSLLKCLNRLYPYSGTIRYRSNDIREMNVERLRRKVVYVSQVPVTFPGTVEENVTWGVDILTGDTLQESILDVDVNHLLEQVGLPTDVKEKNASNLSVGQKQRLHLARSLAIEPDVLLLDEPASSLDAISKEAFENLIQSLMKSHEDLTIIMITHDLEQAKRVAEYAVLLVDGSIKISENAEIFFNEVKDLTGAKLLEELIGDEEENS